MVATSYDINRRRVYSRLRRRQSYKGCEHTMRRRDESPINIARLDYQEAGDVIRFQKLCVEKFGQQFQQDKNYRHQAVDLLLAAVENIGK